MRLSIYNGMDNGIGGYFVYTILVNEINFMHTHLHTYIYIYIYIFQNHLEAFFLPSLTFSIYNNYFAYFK